VIEPVAESGEDEQDERDRGEEDVERDRGGEEEDVILAGVVPDPAGIVLRRIPEPLRKTERDRGQDGLR